MSLPHRHRLRLALLGLALLLLAAAAAALLAHRRGYRLVLAQMRPGSAPLQISAAAPPPRLPHDFAEGAEIRNVVLLVGDGMGFSQLSAAKTAGAGTDGWLFMERFPVTGWVQVHSARSLSTDSAAAATALSTGHKTLLQRISRTPDGQSPATLMERARAAGLRTGLLTTTLLIDATPAAFATHADSRNDFEEIARGMSASGIDLLIGEGGEPGTVEAGALAQSRSLFEAAGYRIAGGWEELRKLDAAGTGQLLALFPPGALSRRSPTLAQLTELALGRLASADRGFFLLVEEEQIDRSSHDASLEDLTAAVRSLDEAARAAVAFARRDGRTLVLITSDHSTGALGLTGGEAGKPFAWRWFETRHTVEPVPLLAYGPGAHHFSGVLDNTEIPRRLGELLRLPAGRGPGS